METGIEGKTAIVTGGSRGIGMATTIELLKSGCNVTITARTQNSLNAFSKKISSAWQKRLHTVVCDFTKDDHLTQFEQSLSASHIDILINSAGINRIGAFESVSLNEFTEIQKVNVEAPFRLCKAVISGMAMQNWGRIVNVTSIFGLVSKAHRLSYSTSKFALNGMTKALALDYAEKGVLVNAVGPGVIETELTRNVLGDKGIKKIITNIPAGRLGQPEEIARIIVFLASGANTYLTGQQIIVDGGYTSA